MSSDSLLASPLAPTSAVTEVPPVHEQTPPADVTRTERVDHVFAQTQERHLVAGLVGMWSGILIYHDLALEAFHRSESEEWERKEREEPDGEAEEP
jgi:hypothetical protein